MIVNPQIIYRPSAVTQRPSGIVVSPAPLFSSLVKSVPVLVSLQSDVGVDVVGGVVSAWYDQSGNGNHFTQATATNRPTYTASLLNGLPGLVFDGIDNWLGSAGPNLPAPGTTPTFVWFVFRQDAWANTKVIWCANAASTINLQMNTATPDLILINPTVGPRNSGAAVGSWVRGEAFCNNATTDYLKLGAVTQTGTALGNNAAAGMFIGRNFANSVFSPISMIAFSVFAGKPSASELAALDSFATLRCGSSVGV